MGFIYYNPNPANKSGHWRCMPVIRLADADVIKYCIE